MTARVTAIANSFGGVKANHPEIEDCLPIKEILASDDPKLLMANYLSKETQLIFDRVVNAPDADPWITKEFRQNEIIWEALEMLRKRNE